MSGISTTLGFDVNGNFPVDQKRMVVADQTERLAIEWVYEGLITYQKDTNQYFKCLVDEKVNLSAPFTAIGDWEELYQDGVDGADGTIWYYGTSAPSGGTGVDGDFYLDTTKGDIYTKISGTWELQLNVIGDRYATTSASSVTIGLGTKNFTVGTGLAYTPQQSVLIVDNAAPGTNNMEGTVTSYNTATGALVVDVTVINGSGTISSWIVNLSGASGSQGNPFEVDAPNVTLSDSLVTSIEGTSVATSNNPYVVTVLNDTRTAATQRVGIAGLMTGNAIAYNGTSWRNYGTWRGPKGDTGFLIGGSANQTARYNGSTNQWEASSVLLNYGNYAAINGPLLINNGYARIGDNSANSNTSFLEFYTSKQVGRGGYIGFGQTGLTDGRFFLYNQTPHSSGNYESYFFSPNNSLIKIGIGINSGATERLDINGNLRVRTLTSGFVKASSSGVLSNQSLIDYNTEVTNKPTIPGVSGTVDRLAVFNTTGSVAASGIQHAVGDTTFFGNSFGGNNLNFRTSGDAFRGQISFPQNSGENAFIAKGFGGIELRTGTDATTVNRLSIASNGVITIPNLSGSGTGMVVASATGVLSRQSIPVGDITNAINVGSSGVGVFHGKSGNTLQFRNISAGAGISVTQITGNNIEISSLSVDNIVNSTSNYKIPNDLDLSSSITSGWLSSSDSFYRASTEWITISGPSGEFNYSSHSKTVESTSRWYLCFEANFLGSGNNSRLQLEIQGSYDNLNWKTFRTETFNIGAEDAWSVFSSKAVVRLGGPRTYYFRLKARCVASGTSFRVTGEPFDARYTMIRLY